MHYTYCNHEVMSVSYIRVREFIHINNIRKIKQKKGTCSSSTSISFSILYFYFYNCYEVRIITYLLYAITCYTYTLFQFKIELCVCVHIFHLKFPFFFFNHKVREIQITKQITIYYYVIIVKLMSNFRNLLLLN